MRCTVPATHIVDPIRRLADRCQQNSVDQNAGGEQIPQVIGYADKPADGFDTWIHTIAMRPAQLFTLTYIDCIRSVYNRAKQEEKRHLLSNAALKGRNALCPSRKSSNQLRKIRMFPSHTGQKHSHRFQGKRS
jgi:hypothetical protein